MEADTLIVGGTGLVGGALLGLAAGGRLRLRALIQAPARAASLPVGVEPVIGNLQDRAAVNRAVQGVRQVFLVLRDSPAQANLERNLVAAAASGGVERVVKVSAFAAGLDPPPGYGRNHAEVELALQRSRLRWTILRPMMYMQSLLDLADPVRRFGLLPLPFGDARIALIDARDVARVAHHVLAMDGHDGCTYVLSGPQAPTLRDCAGEMGRIFGKKVRYLAVPGGLTSILMRLQGVGGWDVAMRRELFRMLRLGGEAQVTSVVKEVTGKVPGTFADFVRDYRNWFMDSESRT
jgi:uncharacterized protein YbjT (DUF2867 family)